MADASTIFHVLPVEGHWQIERDGDPGSVFEHKSDAVDRAVADAQATSPAQVIIHAPNGEIEGERSY